MDICYYKHVYENNLFAHLPSIENLTINVLTEKVKDMGGYLLNFNLDNLVNLKCLSLTGRLHKDFNFGLFKTICNHLEKLSINFPNVNNTYLAKLFSKHQFPVLQTFSIRLPEKIKKLDKKLFNGFSTLQNLILDYKRFQEMNKDVLSNLKQLACLDLRRNWIQSLDCIDFSGFTNMKYLNLSENSLNSIEAKQFSNLTNLRALDLSENQLTILDTKVFSNMKHLKWLNLNKNKLTEFDLSIMDYIKEIKEISLLGNPINNKDEISDRFKESKIEFKI